MPVNSTHPLYDQFAKSSQRVRDVLAGEDAVKAGGIRYVPRLDTQTDSEYAELSGAGILPQCYVADGGANDYFAPSGECAALF